MPDDLDRAASNNGRPATNSGHSGSSMVGVARIELATPTMST